MSEEKKKFWNYQKFVIVGIIVTIASAIGVSYWINQIPSFSNNITLVVEIAVGIVITFIVFRTTKKSEENNQKILDEIQKGVIEEKEIRQSRYKELHWELSRFKSRVDLMIKELSKIENIDLKTIEIVTEKHSQFIKDLRDEFKDILTTEERYQFSEISWRIIKLRMWEFTVNYFESIHNQINMSIESLQKSIDKKIT